MKIRLSLCWLLLVAACGKSPDATTVKTDGSPRSITAEASIAPAKAELAIIARRDLFSSPDHIEPRLSPDGKMLAWLAPVGGILNVWVAPATNVEAAKAITNDGKRGIRVYHWTYDGRHIIYEQDKDGDENWHLYVLDIVTGQTRDATAFQDVKASVVALSPLKKSSAVVALNRRDPEWEDLFELDLAQATLKPLFENRAKLTDMRVSDDYKVMVGDHQNDDGGKDLVLVELGKKAGKPKSIATVRFGDEVTTAAIGFSSDAKTLYMVDSRERDTAALMALDLKTLKSRMLADDAKADVSDVIMHPVTHAPQVVTFEYDTVSTVLLDTDVAADVTALRAVEPGNITWTSTLDNQHWIVTFAGTDTPYRFYTYDRKTREARFLFSARSILEKAQLAHRRAVVIPARDGVPLVSYLTLPFATPREDTQLPERPLPMVLYVHGGPWARDSEGYDGVAQWLANRGYAVLQVNYRGSTGFGKKFVNLANRGWGGSMHEDLVDAVKWAVAQGITKDDTVGIFGGSYGGYATLTGMTKTPTLFRCGVDIVGPSNLETFIAAFPPYWKPYLSMVYERIGDPRNDDGKAFLRERSPLTHIDAIARPLLIAQGANDPRVKRAESEQIVAAMRAKKIPVTYAVFPDEGHGFARPANRLAFFALAEEFLAKHLGGRVEPLGTDGNGSSMQVAND